MKSLMKILTKWTYNSFSKCTWRTKSNCNHLKSLSDKIGRWAQSHVKYKICHIIFAQQDIMPLNESSLYGLQTKKMIGVQGRHLLAFRETLVVGSRLGEHERDIHLQSSQFLIHLLGSKCLGIDNIPFIIVECNKYLYWLYAISFIFRFFS